MRVSWCTADKDLRYISLFWFYECLIYCGVEREYAVPLEFKIRDVRAAVNFTWVLATMSSVHEPAVDKEFEIGRRLEIVGILKITLIQQYAQGCCVGRLHYIAFIVMQLS
jgi:hypothetical protein